MREINEAERRLIFIFDPFGGFGDPAGDCIGRTGWGLAARSRPPKGGKRKFAEVSLYLRTNRIGPGVDVENLSSVRGVHWPRRNRVVGTRIHVVPPEQFGAGELWVLFA